MLQFGIEEDLEEDIQPVLEDVQQIERVTNSHMVANNDLTTRNDYDYVRNSFVAVRPESGGTMSFWVGKVNEVKKMEMAFPRTSKYIGTNFIPVRICMVECTIPLLLDSLRPERNHGLIGY